VDDIQATAESARRRVKRASGLLRDAARDLMAITEGQEALGVHHVHDTESVQGARDLISMGVARYGAVDVIVIARPTGRAARITPTTAAQAAKENTHGTQEHHQAAAARARP